MKELSIKEKAKAYDEAIERAKNLYGNGIAEEIFPELKESDDEKIRKEIISILRNAYWTSNKNRFNELVAWLEKQGEQLTDKNKQRFEVGDLVVDNCGYVWKIEGILNQFYLLEGIEGGESRPTVDWVDENFHIWTIQDAKDGDVLACNEEILLFKSYSVLQGRISLYCWYNGHTNNFHSKEVIDILLPKRHKVCPATKEQRDALMKAMNNAGYEWNAETKTLEKLVEPKFDPKTLKPFDKVLVRDFAGTEWSCDLFSYIENIKSQEESFICTGGISFNFCIPYNDKTKYLVGTTKEAPEYYRYWEDRL